MMVTVPVRRFHMDLDIAGPHLPVDTDSGIEKIGPGIGIQPALVDDDQPPPVNSNHSGTHTETMLPDKLHQLFHDITISADRPDGKSTAA